MTTDIEKEIAIPTGEISEKDVPHEVKAELRRVQKWMWRQIDILRDDEILEFAQKFLHPPFPNTIFLTGLRRSGLVAAGFAMRLAQYGLDNVRILEELTAPPIKEGDLLIVVSGRGTQSPQIEKVKDAKKSGAKVIAITSQEDSPLAQLADLKLVIPGRRKEEGFSPNYKECRAKGLPVLPLGTAFEILSSIVLDCIIHVLLIITGKTEEDMKKRHAEL